MKTRWLWPLVLPAVAALPLHARELPAPWKQADIGTAEVGKMATIAGTAKQADGTFTLAGTMDLWDRRTAFISCGSRRRATWYSSRASRAWTTPAA